MFLPADRVYRLSHMLHDNYQTLHEQGEASFGLSPRHFDLKHTVLRTLHRETRARRKVLNWQVSR